TSAAPPLQDGPQVTILSPEDGATVQGDSITVRVQLKNFKQVPAPVPLSELGKHPELNRPGEGHVHLKLDLNPIVVLDKGDTYTFTNVPLGSHTLEAYLSNNDHADLSPVAEYEVEFKTVAASTSSNAPSAPMSRLPNTAEPTDSPASESVM